MTELFVKTCDIWSPISPQPRHYPCHLQLLQLVLHWAQYRKQTLDQVQAMRKQVEGRRTFGLKLIKLQPTYNWSPQEQANLGHQAEMEVK